MDQQRMLALAAVLSFAGAVLAFLVGLGTALSEEPGHWASWALAALFAAVGALCDLARRRG